MKTKSKKVTQTCDCCKRPASPLRQDRGEWRCGDCVGKPRGEQES